MNNRLRNYTTEPDPDVWNKIQKTLRRQNLRQQAIGGTIGTLIAVAAIVAVVSWPYDTKSTDAKADLPELAQVQEAPINTVPVVDEVAAEPAEVQVQPSPDKKAATPKPQPEEVTAMVPTPMVETAVAAPASVRQPACAPMIVSQPAAKEPTATTPTSAAPQSEAKPETENAVAENTQATPAAKNTIGNGVIADTILWVPNAFAPASDNPDITTFRARLNKVDESILNYRITIFNRQGHQVFHSTDINQAWDGSYKGRALPQGGYVYVIYYVDKDGLTHQRKGTVALIR